MKLPWNTFDELISELGSKSKVPEVGEYFILHNTKTTKAVAPDFKYEEPEDYFTLMQRVESKNCGKDQICAEEIANFEQGETPTLLTRRTGFYFIDSFEQTPLEDRDFYHAWLKA